MGLPSAIKTPRAPPCIAPLVATAHRTPQDGRPSGTPSDLPLCFCSSHCHPARRVFKNAFFWRFCGVINASSRRTFCCVVHQKRDFKAHPAAKTTLLFGSFQLAADSRLSTHSSSTLALGSLSTLETRDPATACVDSEASSSTVALGKAISMGATTRFIVCDPHASLCLILRSGTRDPHQSPSSTRALGIERTRFIIVFSRVRAPQNAQSWCLGRPPSTCAHDYVLSRVAGVSWVLGRQWLKPSRPGGL